MQFKEQLSTLVENVQNLNCSKKFLPSENRNATHSPVFRRLLWLFYQLYTYVYTRKLCEIFLCKQSLKRLLHPSMNIVFRSIFFTLIKLVNLSVYLSIYLSIFVTVILMQIAAWILKIRPFLAYLFYFYLSCTYV